MLRLSEAFPSADNAPHVQYYAKSIREHQISVPLYARPIIKELLISNSSNIWLTMTKDNGT